MNIAVLGLGLLGTEIALRLHAQGHSVVGVNRAIERPRFDAARQQGLPLTADVASAVAGAEMTLLLLSDAAAIEATLMAKATTAAALTGRVLVQMGTIAPDEESGVSNAGHSTGWRIFRSASVGQPARSPRWNLNRYGGWRR